LIVKRATRLFSQGNVKVTILLHNALQHCPCVWRPNMIFILHSALADMQFANRILQASHMHLMEINVDIIVYVCSHFLWLWVWFLLDFFLPPCRWDKVSLLYLVSRFKLKFNWSLICAHIRAWMYLCWFNKKI